MRRAKYVSTTHWRVIAWCFPRYFVRSIRHKSDGRIGIWCDGVRECAQRVCVHSKTNVLLSQLLKWERDRNNSTEWEATTTTKQQRRRRDRNDDNNDDENGNNDNSDGNNSTSMRYRRNDPNREPPKQQLCNETYYNAHLRYSVLSVHSEHVRVDLNSYCCFASRVVLFLIRSFVRQHFFLFVVLCFSLVYFVKCFTSLVRCEYIVHRRVVIVVVRMNSRCLFLAEPSCGLISQL